MLKWAAEKESYLQCGQTPTCDATCHLRRLSWQQWYAHELFFQTLVDLIRMFLPPYVQVVEVHTYALGVAKPQRLVSGALMGV